ncbi:MAG: hypothetical protein PHN69_04485 [Candidatus Pacebacteria bacterium]|nr:hypothetical protein [Fermentimonas sp.]MDD4804411.1 hypothetical protein [Candidatus Paceibacterota bacterium]
MGLFDTDYNNEKQCVYERMLLTESSETLKEFLKFEDLVVGGYSNAFPDKIAYKWEDVLKVEAIENQ